MTNDGNLINGLMRAANFHEKEYVVKVDKEITEDFIKDMAAGVYLKELEQTNSPNLSVLCAGVIFIGRISYSLTFTP